MGFQGTFKGTLKENFDRMMNPRKFLNEMDQFGNTQLSQMGIEQFEENGLYGLKDSNGEIILDPIYASIDTEQYVNGLVTCYLPNGEKRRVDISTEEVDESNIDETPDIVESEIPNLTENYNRIQILNKKL